MSSAETQSISSAGSLKTRSPSGKLIVLGHRAARELFSSACWTRPAVMGIRRRVGAPVFRSKTDVEALLYAEAQGYGDSILAECACGVDAEDAGAGDGAGCCGYGEEEESGDGEGGGVERRYAEEETTGQVLRGGGTE